MAENRRRCLGEDCDGIVPLPEALFVAADVIDGRRSAAIEPSHDGPIHDRLRGIPGEAD
jgi:hypothetical protein